MAKKRKRPAAKSVADPLDGFRARLIAIGLREVDVEYLLAAPQASLDGKSPAWCVANGRTEEVEKMVKGLGG